MTRRHVAGVVIKLVDMGCSLHAIAAARHARGHSVGALTARKTKVGVATAKVQKLNILRREYTAALLRHIRAINPLGGRRNAHGRIGGVGGRATRLGDGATGQTRGLVAHLPVKRLDHCAGIDTALCGGCGCLGAGVTGIYGRKIQAFKRIFESASQIWLWTSYLLRR